MMRPRPVILLLLLLALGPAPAWSAVSVLDDAGKAVVLPEPARRIVALSPHLTELAFAAGAGDRLLAVVEHSDFPPQAASLPSLGAYNAIDWERLLSLKPDLVLAWGSGNGSGQIAQARRLGLAVYVSEPRQPADIARNLRRIGQLAGTDAVAEQAAADFEQALQRLRQRYRDRARVSVFYQIWDVPPMTLGGRHLVSQLIRLCGGRNVFDTLQPLAASVSQESLLLADPQVIIGATKAERQAQWLAGWRAWPQLQAVTRRQLYFVDPDLLNRQTTRIAQGAEQLCQFIDRARRANERR